MASHRSAEKAHRQSEKRRVQNRQFRSRLRTSLKSVREVLDSGTPSEARDALSTTMSLVDRMASKGIIHRNTAARYKSRLVKRLGVKTAASA